ncbi:MAG TPA: hypothetical protein VN694_17080 [Caulobacteraceae bacterium]|nr:hypothetical protein [Caulobacteraceae bacterium]
MKHYFNVLAAAAMVVGSVAATPVFARPPPGVYWSGDICRNAQAHEARRGTRTGAIVGGTIGAAASRSVGGALIGGTVGAVAGSAIGRSRIRCVAPPPRHSRRHNCQWVQDWVNGRWQTFEVCRDHNGFWRASGR